MKRGSFIVLLALLCMPTLVLGQEQGSLDRFEFGAYAGLGMYIGPNKDVLGAQHVQAYTGRSNLNWPGIESFGFSVGYRYDLRWSFKLQTMRQRVAFEELIPTPTRTNKYIYYNAMWHLDAMAEFNILRMGPEMRPGQDVYNIVPFVGLGYGLTFYNENATLRSTRMQGEFEGTRYPRVGYNLLKDDNGKFTVAEKAKTNLAMYVPVAAGVKWRINGNVQLKGTFQYNLYFQQADKSDKYDSWTPTINSNLCGGTELTESDKIYGGVVGNHHNFMLSLGVVVNFGEWDEVLSKKNVRY